MRKIFFVVGKSGAGKTRLTNEAITVLNPEYGLQRIPSCITRPARDGEINGQDFYFIDDCAFQNLIDTNEFIEYENYAGIYYGLLKTSLLKTGNIIKEITPLGLIKVLEYVNALDTLGGTNIKDQIRVIHVNASYNTIYNRLYNRYVVSSYPQNWNQFEQRLKENQKFDHEYQHLCKLLDKDVIFDVDNNVVSFGPYGQFGSDNFIGAIRSQLVKEKNMITIHDGCTIIGDPSNVDKRYAHITVDSESDSSKVYYVTVDRATGKVLGCSCPRSGMFPYEKCKHQKAVINQRLLDL